MRSSKELDSEPFEAGEGQIAPKCKFSQTTSIFKTDAIQRRSRGHAQYALFAAGVHERDER
jgi:hypothetical protein